MSGKIVNTAHGVEFHVAGSDGTVTMQSGPYAGLHAKLIGQGVDVRGGTAVRVVHNTHLVPFMFDPARAPNQQLPPDAAALAQVKPIIAEPVQEEQEIVTERFTTTTPTEANPFADLQVASFDDETPVSVDVETGTEEADTAPVADGDIAPTAPVADAESTLEALQTRDLKNYGISIAEFNALGLSKAQTWKLYEQVIGRTTNRPAVQQAAQAILKKANANSADYTRVVQAISRVFDA
jgi:hypothetical protein